MFFENPSHSIIIMYVPNRHVGHIYNLQETNYFHTCFAEYRKDNIFFFGFVTYGWGSYWIFFLGSSIHIYSEREVNFRLENY